MYGCFDKIDTSSESNIYDMNDWDYLAQRPQQSFDLSPIRTLLDNNYAATQAMRNFTVSPYLYLCWLAYALPHIRLQFLTRRWPFRIFRDDNHEKRFAVTCPGILSNTLIICFRGTVPSDFEDMITDKALLSSNPDDFGRTARVNRELNQVAELYQDFLQEHPTGGRIILTGHSLGGTVAFYVSQAFPSFDAVTFNMGSARFRLIRQRQDVARQQRRGVGLHIRAHSDPLSSNPGDDGNDRNILVKVRLPGVQRESSLQYHGTDYLMQHEDYIDAAILRRLGGYLNGGRRKCRITTKARKSIKSRKTRKALKSRKSRNVKTRRGKLSKKSSQKRQRQIGRNK